MAAGRVRSTTPSIADSMYSLHNLTIPSDVTFLAFMSAVMSTRERGLADGGTRIVIREWKFMALHYNLVIAIQHDLWNPNLT